MISSKKLMYEISSYLDSFCKCDKNLKFKKLVLDHLSTRKKLIDIDFEYGIRTDNADQKGFVIFSDHFKDDPIIWNDFLQKSFKLFSMDSNQLNSLFAFAKKNPVYQAVGFTFFKNEFNSIKLYYDIRYLSEESVETLLNLFGKIVKLDKKEILKQDLAILSLDICREKITFKKYTTIFVKGFFRNNIKYRKVMSDFFLKNYSKKMPFWCYYQEKYDSNYNLISTAISLKADAFPKGEKFLKNQKSICPSFIALNLNSGKETYYFLFK